MNDHDPGHVDMPDPEPRPQPPERSIGMTILKVFLWSLAAIVGLMVLAVGLVLGTCFFGR